MAHELLFAVLMLLAGFVRGIHEGMVMVMPWDGLSVWELGREPGVRSHRWFEEYHSVSVARSLLMIGIGAALMAGWTCLLIWADRKPVERRGVLLLTIVPVIAGLRLSEIYLFVYGYVTVADMIPSWIMGVLTLALFIFSYVKSASLVKTEGKKG